MLRPNIAVIVFLDRGSVLSRNNLELIMAHIQLNCWAMLTKTRRDLPEDSKSSDQKRLSLWIQLSVLSNCNFLGRLGLSSLQFLIDDEVA
jgi:hypothetical protein